MSLVGHQLRAEPVPLVEVLGQQVQQVGVLVQEAELSVGVQVEVMGQLEVLTPEVQQLEMMLSSEVQEAQRLEVQVESTG